ncbi:MAG: bifunctional oligoribonuclease/PAP phosphatase NrnA [Firmicutes bacterium HGW-Firmicutes-13]|nr:MAG: bifunctional oligoribonuclease/PAP phosphatase NrnA [Firmicutes bacterium HGW-Firmicutes-13]
MTDKQLEKIANLLRKENNYLIASHLNPDGDSVGSLLALGMALMGMGKKVTLTTIDPVPLKYRFLPGTDFIKEWKEVNSQEFNYLVVLDCSDLSRLEPLSRDLFVRERMINIDHHVTNEFFAEYSYVNPRAGSVGEIIFQLLEQMKLKITYDMALCLYVAVCTDTGSFRYSNTSAGTHRTAARLLELGVEPSYMTEKIYENVTKEGILLIREALNTLSFDYGDKIAHITITNVIMNRTGAREEDTEGIVNYTRNIQGVEIGILFREICEWKTRVGFRSRNIDVSKLAGMFNGGGHPRAAGCQVNKDLPEAKREVLKKAKRFLEESEIIR